MRIIYSFFFLIFLCCSACLQTYPVRDTPPIGKRLSPIPTFAHNKEVTLFPPGSFPADSNYFKIVTLEVKGPNFYEDLQKKMMAEGAKAGVDAVLLAEPKTIPTDASPYPEMSLSGIGIKYHDQLDYLSNYLKAKHIYHRVDTGWEQVARVDWSLDGKEQLVTDLTGTGDSILAKYVKPYDLWHLLWEQNENWKYTFVNVRPQRSTTFRVLHRRYYIEGKQQKSCKFFFANINAPRPNKARIYAKPPHALFSPYSQTVLIMNWLPNGLLADMKIIPPKKAPKLRYSQTFKADGKCLGGVMQWYREDGEHITFLKIAYEFYTLEDFQGPASPNAQYLPKEKW